MPNVDNQRENQFSATEQADRQTRKQMRLPDVLYALRKHAALILVCCIVGLVLGILLSVVSFMRGEMKKQYAIKSSIAVVSQNKNGLFTAQSNNPNSSDIHLAESMVDSVIYVLRSDQTLNATIERLELLGITAKDIYDNLTLYQYKETQIIEMTLYWRSAQEGVEILKAINEVAPKILVDTLKIGNVSVINEPTAKYLIGGSISAVTWGYMTVLGLLMGIGFSVLELLLRPRILDPLDMERVFSLEVLGEIPERKKYFQKRRSLLMDGGQDEIHADVVDNYISLAHILKNRIRLLEHPCVYVTSATQNEGKTTSTAYLAVQLAELGMKVLLVDFDTRNPKLGGMFLNKVEYAHSLNALYRGESTREEAVTKLTGNLDLLPTVLERRPFPLDEALLDVLDELRKDYDVILMDTAPVGQVADTMSLNRLADVALMVVRFDGAELEVIRDALARLDKSGMQILGCLVNGVKNMRRDNDYSSFYGYGQLGSAGVKSKRQEEWEAWERSSGSNMQENAASEENLNGKK